MTIVTKIRILADDLTGALDTAAAFAGEVPVYIDAAPACAEKETKEANEANEVPVAIVATPTRDLAPADLPAHLQPVLAWFAGGDIAFKKVDSLLRGNSFAEVAWLAQHGGFAETLFAPAFPAQGRVTAEGRQWVVDPKNPTGVRKSAALPFAEAFAAHGLQAALRAPDVFSDGELDRLVADAGLASSRSRLWCGSAGLGHALARRLGLAPAAGETPTPLPRRDDGPNIFLTASHHPVLREQWQVLRRQVRPQALCEAASAAQFNAAVEALQEGARSAWFDLSPAQPISPDEAARGLAAQMSRLVATCPKPAQLIIVGGDTLLSACRSSACASLQTAPAIRGGWGCARLQGGAWDGVPCYSRSGAFGGGDDLLSMIRALACGDDL